MKTHNTLKELLKDFLNEYFDRTVNNGNETDEVVLTDFVASNSLALGKQKSLAKKKQSENKCECSIINGKGGQLLRLCDYCIDKSWKEAFE